MDRTTVRIILVVLGVLVIAGIYFWHQYRDDILASFRGSPRRPRRPTKEAAPPGARRETMLPPAESADAGGYFADDFELSPVRIRNFGRPAETPEPPLDFEIRSDPEPTTTPPSVIQLSVVAMEDAFFTGGELVDAFHQVGMKFGEMGIFHRIGPDGAIQFSAASLVEPGTFPINDMLSFESPGLVLFFQPSLVRDPVEVFDDLIACCHELAVRLHGLEWDAGRQVLTRDKVAALRATLR